MSGIMVITGGSRGIGTATARLAAGWLSARHVLRLTIKQPLAYNLRRSMVHVTLRIRPCSRPSLEARIPTVAWASRTKNLPVNS